MADYHPQDLDRKWQQRWADSRAFEVSVDPSRPKFYCLEMFAYPSGHAHVGHVRNYIIGDVVARTKRMRGYNVLHPFGGTHSACQPRMRRSRAGFIRRSQPGATSRT